jgi:flagellar motor switch protein FliN/FliY
MSESRARALLAAFAEELASVIGEIGGAAVEAADGRDDAAPRRWVATLAAGSERAGTCVVAFDHEGVAALSRLGASGEGEVEDATIADLLRNAITRAAAALAARPGADAVDLTLATLEPTGQPDEDGDALSRTLTSAGWAVPIALRLRWLEPAPDAARPDRAEAVDHALGSRLDVILDIDLQVVVRFGHTELPIRTLSRLGPGSVIDLGRSPDDPVEVLVSNRVVARGEVVIVGGNYGVRILDVTSQSERVRSMEA